MFFGRKNKTNFFGNPKAGASCECVCVRERECVIDDDVCGVICLFCCRKDSSWHSYEFVECERESVLCV
jgi:hypothetical protein